VTSSVAALRRIFRATGDDRREVILGPMKWFADPYDAERGVEQVSSTLLVRDSDLPYPIDPETNELRIDLEWLVRWAGGTSAEAT
jgi:hypothetical protein